MKEKKIARAFGVIVSVFVLLVFGTMVGKTAIIPGLNPEIEEKKGGLIRESNQQSTVEGCFLDRDGAAITAASEPGVPAEVLDNSFGSIIGYNCTFGVSGLREKYEVPLFSGGRDNVGATIQTTLATSLQKAAYQAIAGMTGSAIILNASTGEVLAFANRSAKYEFEVNKMDDVYKTVDGKEVTYSQLYNAQPDGFWYNDAVDSKDAPGSTFKMVTAAAAFKEGLEDFETDVTGPFQVGDGYITNFGGESGVYDLFTGARDSVNVYFARLGLELKAHKLQRVAESFMVGKEVELDFCTLSSSWKNDDSAMTQYLLASNGFGQGELAVPPLLTCLITSALTNDGTMMKPNLITSISNDGRTTLKAKEKVLSKTVGKSAAKKTKELFHQVATEGGAYCLYDVYGEDEAYFIAKTGTAEVGGNRPDHIYYTVGMELPNGERYALIVSRTDTPKNGDGSYLTGSSLRERVLTLIDAVLNYAAA